MKVRTAKIIAFRTTLTDWHYTFSFHFRYCKSRSEQAYRGGEVVNDVQGRSNCYAKFGPGDFRRFETQPMSWYMDHKY